MCIRDSLKVAQIDEKEVFESPERKEAIADYILRHHAAKTQNGRFCAMMCTCLLYTSDAADERSSVDLGGRRIIKKKKNQTYFCFRFWLKE